MARDGRVGGVGRNRPVRRVGDLPGKASRYKILKSGYVIDRRVFQFASALIVILAITYLVVFGVQREIYATCPLEAPGGVCWNPLYGECEVVPDDCDRELLTAGEIIGTPPNNLAVQMADMLMLIFIGILGIAFFGNHFLHNWTRRTA